MPNVDRFSVGAPCWADLSTSDVEGSRVFYAALFGWEAMEPSEEFGGYFMFHRNGSPIAGGMGGMGPDMPANDTWKIYLSTDDIAGVTSRMEALGAKRIQQVQTWWVMEAPTGQRFCVVRVQGDEFAQQARTWG